ncbi:MAG: type VI secretion system-associated FHA domain protein [Myxococcota bacterium]
MKPVIITVFDSEKRTTTDYSFAKSPIRIGRNPLNDLALPFAFVSGWHAVVRFDENQPRFYDLGSTNGTLYEGRKIEPGEPLDVGQLLSVTIGRLELRLRRGDADVHTSSGTAPMSNPPAAGSVGPTQITPAHIPPPGPGAVRKLEAPLGGTATPQVGPTAAHPAMPPLMPSQPASSAPPSSAPPPSNAPAPARGGTHSPLGIAAKQSRAGLIDSSVPAPMGGDDGTAHVQMGAVHDAIQAARPRYAQMKQSAEHLVAELANHMQSMPPPLQQLAIPMLAREFPEVAGLPQFAELAARVGAKVPQARGGGGGGLQPVQRLSAKVRAEEPPPKSPEEAERFLACVADMLVAGASALIELQKGQEQFGNEMGVRVIKEFTPLHAAGTPENLLRYLLDWNKGGPHRTQELRGVYADLMIHQVALIRGVVEGARSLIARLDPREIERRLQSAWPSKSAAAWKAYEKLWQELASSDRQITELVFGPEFARAYAEVGGEG